MRPGRCRHAARWIDQAAADLSQEERSALEGHLSGCDACRRHAAAIDLFRQLSEVAVRLGPAPAAIYQRSIARSFQVAAAAPTPSAGRIRPPVLFGATALVGAAVVLIAGTLTGGWPFESVQPSPAPAPAARGDRVLAGEVVQQGRHLGSGEALRSGFPLSTVAGATLAFGHAEVTLGAGGGVRWDPETMTVTLDDGGVDVEVDPAPGRSFRVATPRFSAEVLGTRFRVDAAGVRVTRGAVRVVAPDGSILAARLSAGDAFTLPEAPAAPDAPAARPARREGKSSARWIAEARSHLAARRLEDAHRDLDAALAARPSRIEAAEAETLLSECLLVGGDQAGAAARYAAVAERYADLPAGETALYAAARLEATAGARDAARRLFRRYLDRYPGGRFRNEATDRLAATERRIP